MKYDSGLQSVHKSGVITLKQFDEGYALIEKEYCAKCDRFALNQKSVITKHWMENIDFLLNTTEKCRPAIKDCCDQHFKPKIWRLVQDNDILYLW